MGKTALTKEETSLNEVNYTRNSDAVAVLDYSPCHIISEKEENDDVFERAKDLDGEVGAKGDTKGANAVLTRTSFEPEPETEKIASSLKEVEEAEERDDEAQMLELNHKSLRLLQAQVIKHIENIGQAAHLYDLDEETTQTFNRAINDCFETNRNFTKELYNLKERHD